jgi:hypothetical protein
MNEMMSEQIYETMENYPDALVNFGDGPIEIRVREAERRLDLKVSSRPVSWLLRLRLPLCIWLFLRDINNRNGNLYCC